MRLQTLTLKVDFNKANELLGHNMSGQTPLVLKCKVFQSKTPAQLQQQSTVACKVD